MSMRRTSNRETQRGGDRQRTWWNFYQRQAVEIAATLALGIANAIRIALLEGRVITNENDIAALDVRVTQNESDIADLQANQLVPVRLDTAGSTYTLPASPAEGLWYSIRNTSTGTVSIDPNGNNLEGASATFPLYSQESIIIRYTTADGWREGA